MNVKGRRKKQLKNIICVTYCLVWLLIVLFCFHKLGGVLELIQNAGEAETVFGDGVAEPEGDKGGDLEDSLVVCLDAGHGGNDHGSDYQTRLEKDDNLKIALAVAAYLEEQGVTVVMTREDDTYLSLAERCDIANESEADYFVSLHRNDGDGYGVETWVYSGANEKTMALAENIMEGLETVGVQRNRGIKKGTQKSSSSNYYVNVHSEMPACIVELGFINDETDNSLFDEKLEEYAAAIGDAVIGTYELYGEGTAQGTGADKNDTDVSTENPGSGDTD